MVHAELIIRLAPDELANVIRDEKCNEANKEGEETALARPPAVVHVHALHRFTRRS